MKKDSIKQHNKKVLMLCYYFPPCSRVGALRSKKFVQYLGNFGWGSVVLNAYRGYRGEYDSDGNVEVHSTFRWDLLAIVNVLPSVGHFCINRSKRFLSLFSSGSPIAAGDKSDSVSVKSVNEFGVATVITRWLLFPDLKVFWVLFTLPKAIYLLRKCDVIYSSLSPYSAHILGLILKKLTGKPWIADYRDEWSLNINWNPPTRFHRWLGKKLDKACVKNADIVVNVTEPRTEMFKDYFGGCLEKFVTIPNGYDEADIVPFRDLDIPQEHLVMTSLGSIYGGRDIKPLIRAVTKAFDERKIDRRLLRIRFIGAINTARVKEVEKLDIGNVVEFIPRIPQQEAFMALGQSHVAVLIGSDMEKVAMTTKVYEYAGMGKPILALAPEGPIRDFVNKCGGWCIDCGDVDEISKVVTNIFEQYKRGELGTHIKQEFVKDHERSVLTGQLVDYLNLCVD